MDRVAKKVLLLSAGDVNGAYEAIYRIGTILIKDGHHVKMLVRHKSRKDDFIIPYHKPAQSLFTAVASKIGRSVLHRIRSNKNTVRFDSKYNFLSVDEASFNISAENVLRQIGFTPDYIITGMTNGFTNSSDLVNLQQLSNAKVYNITVDMNHFSGGCHYAWDCTGYIRGCDENCPAIIGAKSRHLAKDNFEIKYRNALAGKFKAIAMSGWTVNQIRESKIYRSQSTVHNINSIIDTAIFNKDNKDIAKRIFGFDDSKFYIMAGSQSTHDPRKGFAYFMQAIKVLESELSTEQKDKIVLVVVSREIPPEFESLKFEKQKIDYINDYRLLALLYQSINLFVNASIEDSGPMMVSEALSCGTPVVGFDMGVVNNIVISGFNGYKATLKDSVDLAKGINTVISLTKEEYHTYSENAAAFIETNASYRYVSNIFSQIFDYNDV